MKPHSRTILAALLAAALAFSPALSRAAVQQGEKAGYFLVPNDKVPETFNGGFSMYVAAWPLLREYPGNRFQTGLFGTWMFAQKRDREYLLPPGRGQLAEIDSALIVTPARGLEVGYVPIVTRQAAKE